MEDECMWSEQFSVDELSEFDMPIPKTTIAYCKKKADATGGSYQIMLKCVKSELQAQGKFDFPAGKSPAEK